MSPLIPSCHLPTKVLEALVAFATTAASFLCEWLHKNKCQTWNKNTGLRTDSPLGYFHWWYLRDLEAPAVLGGVVSHLSFLDHHQKPSGMPPMANHEGESGPCRGSNTATWDRRTAINGSSCRRAVGVWVDHFRSSLAHKCWQLFEDRERWQDLQALQTFDFWCSLQVKTRWVIAWTNSFTKFW